CATECTDGIRRHSVLSSPHIYASSPEWTRSALCATHLIVGEISLDRIRAGACHTLPAQLLNAERLACTGRRFGVKSDAAPIIPST
ncbi:unnamed protein product, partial [Mycena citricolor]